MTKIIKRKKIRYIAVIKEWRDKLYGNTYFSANIDDLEKDKTYKIPFQFRGLFLQKFLLAVDPL